LGIIGGLIGVGVLSGAAPPPVSALLITVFVAAAAALLLDIQPEQLLSRSRSSLTAMRMSAEAREAVERARRRGGGYREALTLLDVGLIRLQTEQDGMAMARTRSVSLDDDGVRPYITLHVDPQEADRTAIIRFEIIDHNGEFLFIHEMRVFLRDGEMNIVADHQLPLRDNPRIKSAGEWDMRVSVDGVLIGALGFTVTPSLRDRMRRFSAEAEAPASRQTRLADPIDDDAPMSLEELLRSQQRQDRGGRS
jgi:hypothetical protein